MFAECEICGKQVVKRGIRNHHWRVHGEGQNHRPNSGVNRVTWNKGLSKSTDVRVAKNSEQVSKTIQNLIATGSWTFPSISDEGRHRISTALSGNNHGGRCKWYVVDGIKVQGTWERDLALKMSELGIAWEKLKRGESFTYVMNGQHRHYTPDFRVSSLLLEVKGYWWGDDREKMLNVVQQNAELAKSLRILEKDRYLALLNATTADEFFGLLA